MTIEVLSPISSTKQYAAYLEELAKLGKQCRDKTNEGLVERIKHVAILLEAYESEIIRLPAPDAISAIRLRMHERELTPKDMSGYIGAKGKVSEILNGKRPLTLGMIRRLAEGLDIPADILIETHNTPKEDGGDPQWSLFPVAEMHKRGWIQAKTIRSKNLASEMKEFFQFKHPDLLVASYKKELTLRSQSLTAEYARAAWLSRALAVASSATSKYKFQRKKIDLNLLQNICSLSVHHNGPEQAFRALREIGIAVVYEPPLSGSYVDGAAFFAQSVPVIAITLRHDRIDAFWFTLLHELVHVWKHLEEDESFLDDFDKDDSEDKRESEANRIARDALVPRIEWRRSQASKNPSIESILSLSREITRDPAIVAGRVRRDFNDYSLFSQIVSQSGLREQLKAGVQ